MTLAQLREKLKADRAKLADLRVKAAALGASSDARATLKNALTECEQLLDLIKDAEREEAIDAEATKAAGGAATGGELDQTGHGRAPAAATVKMTTKQEISLMAAVAAKQGYAFRSHRIVTAEQILIDEGFSGFVKVLKDRGAIRSKTNTTLTPQDGGVLLPTPNSSTIIDFLRPVNTFIAAGPKTVPLISGRFTQPRGATTATTGYVGEGMRKPVGSPTFNSINMISKKIAGIVTVTDEALAWSLADLQGYIENDLQSSLGSNVDLACYFGPGTAYTPLGVLLRPNISVFNAASTAPAYFANPKAPTVAEIDAMLNRMMLSITDYNIQRNMKWAWVTNWHVIDYMANLRGANGDKIYPTLEGDMPTLRNIRVLITNQFPSNGGTNTDESTLALIDFSHVLWGEDGEMRMKTSMEATIDPGTGTLIHLFQQNMMAVLVEMRHDIALEYDQAVSVLQRVRWGSASAN